MKGLTQHILEKLKVSSKRNLPSIDDFCDIFFQYIQSERKTSIKFLDLDVCKGFDLDNPETFDILPSYEFTGHEKFLYMSNNRGIYIPKGTIYLTNIDMYLTSSKDDYYFSFHYLLEGGLAIMDFKQPYNFRIRKEDLLDVISEDLYLELYDYLKQYEKD